MLIDQIKENDIALKKQRKETMTDEDYADDLALLANTSAQAEYLLHSPEKFTEAMASTWMQIKLCICFKQKGVPSTLCGKPLRLEDQVTYFGINISSIETCT